MWCKIKFLLEYFANIWLFVLMTNNTIYIENFQLRKAIIAPKRTHPKTRWNWNGSCSGRVFRQLAHLLGYLNKLKIYRWVSKIRTCNIFWLSNFNNLCLLRSHICKYILLAVVRLSFEIVDVWTDRQVDSFYGMFLTSSRCIPTELKLWPTSGLSVIYFQKSYFKTAEPLLSLKLC